MQHQAKASVISVFGRRTPRSDRIMQGVIAGGGLSVLALLAWAHLGFGALLAPPSPTPPQMTVASGRFVVTLLADSGQFVVGNGNVVSFVVHDSAGQPVTNATVRIHSDMTTMAMPVPDVTAKAVGGGRYTARLMFSMAGPWRLTVTALAPDQKAVRVALNVGVRWR